MSHLLEKALAAPLRIRSGVRTDQELTAHVELAVAFFEGRITPEQARVALGRNDDQNLNARMGTMIGQGIRRGLLIVQLKTEGQQQEAEQ